MAAIQSAPRRWPRRLVLGIGALLLVLVSYWGVRTGSHLWAFRNHLTILHKRALTRPSTMGEPLLILQQDLHTLHGDLAPLFKLAPHLGWLPWIGPTVQAAPSLFSAAELALDATVEAWPLFKAPLEALEGGAPLEKVVPLFCQQLERDTPCLRQAISLARQSFALLRQVSPEGLVSPLDELLPQIQEGLPLFDAIVEGAPLLPRFCQKEGASFLLLAQNNDELRPTGGFISSIGLLTLAHGVPQKLTLEDSYQVENWRMPHPDPPEPLRRYMGLDLWVTRDANWWPDFPTSAEAVVQLYTLNQGRRVDGVLAIDMSGAAELLDALAPLELPNGQSLAPGEAREAFLRSWSLPPEKLVLAPAVITATKPFTGVVVALTYARKEGRVWFDEVLLEDSKHPQQNLLRNPSFEEDTDGDGLPDGWQAEGLDSVDGLTKEKAADGAHSLLLTGGGRKRVLQVVPFAGKAGSTLHLSAKSSSEDVPTRSGLYALEVTFLYADGTRDSQGLGFPPLTHGWASAGSDKVLAEWWRHRKDFMGQMLQAAVTKLASAPKWQLLALLGTLRRVLDERHLQLYFADPELQAFVERRGWAGALQRPEGDYLLVVDSNLGYNKVNASIDQRIVYHVKLATGSPPQAQLTLYYYNKSIPKHKECDKFRQYVPTYEALTQGCYWDYLRIYLPQGAELLETDGLDEPVEVSSELEYTVFATYFVLPPGKERTLRFRYRLPPSILRGTRYNLYVQKQAGTEAIPLEVLVRGPARLQPAEGCLPVKLGKDGSVAHYQGDLRVDRCFTFELAEKR